MSKVTNLLSLLESDVTAKLLSIFGIDFVVDKDDLDMNPELYQKLLDYLTTNKVSKVKFDFDADSADFDQKELMAIVMKPENEFTIGDDVYFTGYLDKDMKYLFLGQGSKSQSAHFDCYKVIK